MEHLTITYIAANAAAMVNDVLYLAAKHQCHIEESRMTMTGSDVAGVMRFTGQWHNIATLEEALTALQREQTLPLQFKRTQPLTLTGDFLPYMAQVIALDTPGLIYEISAFFTTQHIHIIDLQTDPFKTMHSETMMLTAGLRLNIPAQINISELRERFMVLCEELNIDGILEPEKR